MNKTIHTFTLIFVFFILFVNFTKALGTPPVEPTIILSEYIINEGIAPKTQVALLSVINSEEGRTYTFNLKTSNAFADNRKFTINGNQLLITEIPDFETQKQYEIQIEAISDLGASISKVFIINVSDLNSPKFITQIYTRRTPINRIVAHDNSLWIAADGGLTKMTNNVVQTIYTQASGLSGNNVIDVQFDASNVMWVATNQGLTQITTNAKYNYTVTDGLADNNITALAIDNNGAVWCATWGKGVSVYDGKTWTTYTVANGLADNYVNDIEKAPDGKMWLATALGISVFNGTEFTNYNKSNGLIHNEVNTLAIDQNGMVWAGTWLGASKFDGSRWTNITVNDGLIDNFVLQIAAQNGNVWFSTLNGVSKFDGSVWINYTKTDGLADNQVTAICAENNNVWFGTDFGLSKLSNNLWTTYSVSDNLIHNQVNSLAISDNGNLWFATWGGVAIFDRSNWSSLTQSNGLTTNIINDIATTNGTSETFWLATEKGITSYKSGSFTHYSNINGLPLSNYKSVALEANGKVWVTSWGSGVSVFDGSSWRNFNKTMGLCDNNVFCVAIDAANNKWFGTANGLSKYDGTNWITINYPAQLGTNEIKSIVFDKNGTMWLGAWNGGIAKFENNVWTSYTTTNGLISNNVNTLFVDKNNKLWIGTTAGLSSFDGSQWSHYTTADGLISNTINHIEQDSEGWLWLATSQGVVKAKEWNNSPTEIYFSDLQIDEDSPLAESIGSFQTLDADADDRPSYYLQSGNGLNDKDNAKFRIEGNRLFANQPLLYSQQKVYNIRILSNDGYKGTVIQNFTIELININNNAPVMIQNSFTVKEHSPNGLKIGTIQATDADENLNQLTFSIKDGNHNSAFSINSKTGELFVNNSNSVYYELITSFNLAVEVSDTEHSSLKYHPIIVENIDEQTLTAFNNVFTISENTENQTHIGSMYAFGGLSVSYDFSIVGGNFYNAFSIDKTTGEMSINNSIAIDYETNNQFSLRIEVSDGYAQSISTCTVYITNSNDNAPLVENQYFTINENAANGSLVAKILANDPDGAINPLVYRIINESVANAFVVNAENGNITVNNSALLDYETTKNLLLTVEVSDGIYNSQTTVNVALTNTNDNYPVATQPTFSIAENSSPFSVVGRVSATDIDDLQSLTYSIVGGNINNTFAIAAASGLITINNSQMLDYETIPTFALSVNISDSGNSTIIPVVINLTDVFEISEISETAEFQLNTYPNPATTDLTIEFPEIQEIVSLSLYTISGQMVYNQIYNTPSNMFRIDVSQWVSGAYILSFRTKNVSISKSIIINH